MRMFQVWGINYESLDLFGIWHANNLLKMEILKISEGSANWSVTPLPWVRRPTQRMCSTHDKLLWTSTKWPLSMVNRAPDISSTNMARSKDDSELRISICHRDQPWCDNILTAGSDCRGLGIHGHRKTTNVLFNSKKREMTFLPEL